MLLMQYSFHYDCIVFKVLCRMHFAYLYLMTVSPIQNMCCIPQFMTSNLSCSLKWNPNCHFQHYTLLNFTHYFTMRPPTQFTSPNFAKFYHFNFTLFRYPVFRVLNEITSLILNEILNNTVLLCQ